MSDPVVTTQDYVRAAIAGDAVKAKEIFNQLMAPKVVSAIDAAKNEVAQSYFGEKPEVEEPAGEADTEQSAEQEDGQEGEQTAELEDDQVTKPEEETHENT